MQKFSICRDADYYLAFPDVALTPSGRLVCAFLECTHHGDRSYTRIMLTSSDDRGRTWSPKRPATEPLRYALGDKSMPWWNCPRLSMLSDGRLALLVDRPEAARPGDETVSSRTTNFLCFSSDEGETWTAPITTPLHGIVPDKLIELKRSPHAGRWLLTAHARLEPPDYRLWGVRTWLSDDQGQSWQGPFTVAQAPELQLCEASLMELPSGELVCFLRENSFRGLDAFKTISRDGGQTWTTPTAFPLPACHRPVAGMLQSGRVLITHRFMQGGHGWVGWWTQNFFAALTDVESCLAEERRLAHTRILPVDYDRNPKSDTGYSGWVQFPDGEIYIVNYILDDVPRGQIRGYSLYESDFLLQ